MQYYYTLKYTGFKIAIVSIYKPSLTNVNVWVEKNKQMNRHNHPCIDKKISCIDKIMYIHKDIYSQRKVCHKVKIASYISVFPA